MRQVPRVAAKAVGNGQGDSRVLFRNETQWSKLKRTTLSAEGVIPLLNAAGSARDLLILAAGLAYLLWLALIERPTRNRALSWPTIIDSIVCVRPTLMASEPT